MTSTHYTAAAYSNLAMALLYSGNYRAAQPIAESLRFNLRKETLGGRHTRTAASYAVLGNSITQYQRNNLAAGRLLKASKICAGYWWRFKRRRATLSMDYIQLGMKKEPAIESGSTTTHQKSLSTFESTVATKTSTTAISYFNLGTNLAFQGQYAAAEALIVEGNKNTGEF